MCKSKSINWLVRCSHSNQKIKMRDHFLSLGLLTLVNCFVMRLPQLHKCWERRETCFCASHILSYCMCERLFNLVFSVLVHTSKHLCEVTMAHQSAAIWGITTVVGSVCCSFTKTAVNTFLIVAGLVWSEGSGVGMSDAKSLCTVHKLSLPKQHKRDWTTVMCCLI